MKTKEQLEKRIEELEVLCSDLYVAGAELDLPEKILDQLYAASAGENLPYRSILPFEKDKS